jgi:hypothetical protein
MLPWTPDIPLVRLTHIEMGISLDVIMRVTIIGSVEWSAQTADPKVTPAIQIDLARFFAPKDKTDAQEHEGP